VIVGWDDQGPGTGDDYWIVRNSWGTSGGDVNSGYGGYFYMTQDPTTGFFGIYQEAAIISGVTPPGYTVTFYTNPTSWAGSPGCFTVDGSGPCYTNGQTASLTGGHTVSVSVPSGYQFVWVAGNRNPPQSDPTGVYVPNISANPTSFDVNGNGWLKATFAAVITFHTNTGTGSISYGSQPYTDGQTRAEANLLPDYGNTVTITANPPSGVRFVSWSVSGMLTVDSSSSQTTTLHVNGPGTFTANFNLNPPAAPVLVGPADWETVSSLTPTLSWQVSTGATDYAVMIYTWGGSLVTSQVVTGTSYTVGSGLLSSGQTYTWMVSAHNSAGYSSPSSRAFMTPGVTPPSAPVLVGPADWATVSLTPTLSWQASTGTTDYVVRIYTWSGSVVTTQNVVAVSYTVGSGLLSSGQAYTWVVWPHNGAGYGGGSGRAFMTSGVVPPAAPVLVGPADWATVSLTPTLSWQASAGATDYVVRIYTWSGSTVVTAVVTGTSYTVPSGLLSNGQTYTWVVWPHNGAGYGNPTGRAFMT
jgi:hypothetical protein